MNKPRVSIIVAIDEKRGIGKNNDLLFKIPEDFKRMRALTTGHPIIMGRRTFESIGRVLPNRANIIVTRDPNYKVEGGFVVGSLKKAIEMAKDIEKNRHSGERERLQNPDSGPASTRGEQARMTEGAEEVFIFGGGQIFKEAIEKGLVDRLYLTIVQGDYGADTFFPEYSRFTKVIEKEDRDSDGYQYKFLTLEK